MICAAAGMLGKPCDFYRPEDGTTRPDAHHVVPQQVIRGQYTTLKGLASFRREQLGFPDPDSLPSQEEALADERNLLPLCRFHHNALEKERKFKLPMRVLPEGVEDFARELRVDWFFDRGTMYVR